jgi:hypothetical protein
MEVGRHCDMMASERSTIGSNLYDKLKNFRYIGYLLKKKKIVLARKYKVLHYGTTMTHK